ncbi:MAG: GntR family transcriptional regulator [Pleomorphochaeta sp.]
MEIENKNINDYIYEEIKNLLDNHVLPINRKINKLELSNKFNVSLTPINAALNKLVGENYLTYVPRKGFFIKQISKKEILEAFDILAAIESIAIKLFSTNIDYNKIEKLTHFFDEFSNGIEENLINDYLKTEKYFHQKIIEYSDNKKLLEIYNSLKFYTNYYHRNINNLNLSLIEHLQITNNLNHHNFIEAQQAIENHFLNSKDRLLKTKDNN